MKGSQAMMSKCGEQPGQTLGVFAARVVDRLRVAAPQLRLGQGEITAAALDRFLAGKGY
jgi:hypothetical protein